MSGLKEEASYYIKELGGPNGESAWHRLVEADDTIIPYLIEAYRAEPEAKRRSMLVNVIWEHRVKEALEFVCEEALNDPAPEVWKSALDGVVTTGGQRALSALESAKKRLHGVEKETEDKAVWIDEAIEQVTGRS